MKFILDTNMYIHYNLFTECKWSDLFGNEDLTLIVTPTIIKELDEKKYDQRDHIRKRAQEVISKLRGILNGETVPCGIAVNFPCLSDKIEWESIGLNPLNADDRIIGEVLLFKKESENDGICIVTADFGLELKAKNFNLKVIQPFDTWKRKLIDPRDKEIEKLKELTKTTIPVVKLCFFNESNQICEDTFKTSMEEKVIDLLDDDHIDEIYTNIKEKVQKELSEKGYDFLLPKECIAMYKDSVSNYPEECLKYLHDINKVKIKRSLLIQIPFLLDNSGNLPAEDLDVWLKFPIGLEVSGEIPEFPEEPKKPKRPNSYSDCISMNLGSIELGSSFLNNQKELIGPEIEISTDISVHYKLKRLKHGLKYSLPLFVIFESRQKIHNFQVEYVINIGNHPKKVSGKLFVIISKINKLNMV